MAAYYNEIDPFAAAWLRELIKAGLIAPGEVDERSIKDVRPQDLRGFTQCHFFAGIAVWSYALRRAGWPDDLPVWTGSCPCQSFSASGKGEGFSDKRHLWPAWFRLIKECRPDVIFGEQVASKNGLAWLDVVSANLEGKGYAVGASDICAAGVGAPHIRQRLYFVGESDSARSQSRRQSGETVGYGNSVVSASGAGFVADAQLSGLRGRRASKASPEPGTLKRSERLRAASLLADAAISRRARAREHDGGPSSLPARPPQRGETGELADAEDANGRAGERGEEEGIREDRERRRRSPSGGEINGTVDNTIGNGRRKSGHDDAGHEWLISHAASAVNGFWRDAEWIYCRDEKYRPVSRATQSDVEQMVAGIAHQLGLVRFTGYPPSENAETLIFAPLIAKGKSRAGRLRGYGNALNAEAAIAFIEAYRELREAV